MNAADRPSASALLNRESMKLQVARWRTHVAQMEEVRCVCACACVRSAFACVCVCPRAFAPSLHYLVVVVAVVPSRFWAVERFGSRGREGGREGGREEGE